MKEPPDPDPVEGKAPPSRYPCVMEGIVSDQDVGQACLGMSLQRSDGAHPKWVVRQIIGRRTLEAQRTGQRLSLPSAPVHTALRPGSTASDVLGYLRDNPRTWHRLGVIAAATAKHPKTVSWALHTLCRQGWLETCGAFEPRVNSRYLRYRVREAA